MRYGIHAADVNWILLRNSPYFSASSRNGI
jgi:hypothetical protein